MGSFDLVAGMTARLASVVRVDELADAVVREAAALGFGAVWMAVLDDQARTLTTVRRVIDGVDSTHVMPALPVSDVWLPIGRGFRDRTMINVADPATLYVLERDDDVAPPGQLAMPRSLYDDLRGHPFACGPLWGSRGQPVGAIGLASYRGDQPIPDAVLTGGAVRALLDHAGLAMERALGFDQLRASLSAAQAAAVGEARTRLVGEAASWVAHDVRNLVNIALFEAELGLRSPGAALDRLPRIQLINRTIGDVVARLGRIARSGEPQGGAADLRQIVEDALTMLRPMLHGKSIEVDAELADVPAVRCDRVVAHQVVLNLLVNAQDALAEVAPERRRIRIALAHDGGQVRLTVSDTGPGIAPDVLARLFQQVVTTKRDGHLGLGLAAVHAALEPYGARIAADNAPGGGARFEVALPVAAAAEPAPPPPAPPAAALDKPARILAIDDDPDVVCIIREYLEPLGHAVATATGSAEAVAIATAEPFDLVLCDVAMPKQNGIDVCRSLRDVGYRGKLVLMTGWENYGLPAEQDGVACDLLLKKPFLGADLISAIHTLLGGAA